MSLTPNPEPNVINWGSLWGYNILTAFVIGAVIAGIFLVIYFMLDRE